MVSENFFIDLVLNTLFIHPPFAGEYEDGHSVLVHGRYGTWRMPNPDSEIASQVTSIFTEMWRVYEIENPVMPFVDLRDIEKMKEIISQILRQHTNINRVIFAGFAINAAQEKAQACLDIATWLREKKHISVLLSKPEKVDLWHCKPHFREQVIELFNQNAVPQGKRFDTPTVTDLVQWAETQFQNEEQCIILKNNNAAGWGNVIASSSDNLAQKIRERYKHRISDDVIKGWISAEIWEPWLFTGCCSGLITDTSVEVIWLVEQFTNSIDSGFIGSRSFTSIPPEDEARIYVHTKKILECMQADGIRGIVGADFIVSSAQKCHSVGIILPSGLILKYIEATARMGSHNQELIFVANQAILHSINPNDVIHLRISNCRPEHTNTRSEALRYFIDILKPMATYCDTKTMDKDTVLFYVHRNLGTKYAFVSDSILFFAQKNTQNIEKIIRAYEILKDNNCLHA